MLCIERNAFRIRVASSRSVTAADPAPAPTGALRVHPLTQPCRCVLRLAHVA